MPQHKRMFALVGLAAAGALTLGLAGCSGGSDPASPSEGGSSSDLITIGYVAVGPEGGWRDAHEQAIKDAFTKDAGFDLKYAPAATTSDQKSQLDAFSTFVNDEVDAILLTATEASGWEDSLSWRRRRRSRSCCSTVASMRATTSTPRGSRPTTSRSPSPSASGR